MAYDELSQAAATWQDARREEFFRQAEQLEDHYKRMGIEPVDRKTYFEKREEDECRRLQRRRAKLARQALAARIQLWFGQALRLFTS